MTQFNHRFETYWRSLAACSLAAVTACAESPARAPSAPTAPEKAPVVHVVTASPAGILVNAYVVEGASGLVVVDSALTVSDSRTLRATVDAWGKPLLAVLLTHGHPDHYNGVTALLAGRTEVPVYATAAVSRVIREADAAKEAQWKPVFGDEWPAPRTFPSQSLADGAELTLDGFSWSVHEVGHGESHADSFWSLQAPRYVFLGDVVMNGVHAYMSDGHSAAWISNLTRLRRQLSDAEMLYPGHGVAGGLELFDWQTNYLKAYRATVEHLRQGRSALSEEDKGALTTAMKAKYPEAGLDFLIALGADAVASELAKGQ